MVKFKWKESEKVKGTEREGEELEERTERSKNQKMRQKGPFQSGVNISYHLLQSYPLNDRLISLSHKVAQSR